jgi:hypothetical protein
LTNFTTVYMAAITINWHASSLNPERDRMIERTARSDLELNRLILRLFCQPGKGAVKVLAGLRWQRAQPTGKKSAPMSIKPPIFTV